MPTTSKRRATTPPPRGSKQAASQVSWLTSHGFTVAAVAAVTVLVLGAVVVLATRGGNEEAPAVAEGGAAGVTGPDFHSLVADPTTPARLFVGGHQAVSVSTDAGVSWTPLSSLDDADAMGWAFSQGSIYVSGHPGLNRSDDDAATFERINTGLPGTDVHAFGAGPTVLYGYATDSGTFASPDGGRTWEARAANTGQALFGRIVVDPGDETHLLVADASAGVTESRDGGRTWRGLDTGLRGATWLSRGGDRLDVLVASGPAGAVRSTDGGRTWNRLTVPQGASLVEVAPEDPSILYAGAHQGNAVRVQVSRDGGGTWTKP